MKGLPFNRYSWLITHNSFARLGQKSATGSVILAPTNQQDSITSQLNVCHFLFLFLFFHSVCFSGKFEEKEKKMQPYFHLTKTALLAVAVGSCRLSQCVGF